jgi:hypothetical protein
MRRLSPASRPTSRRLAAVLPLLLAVLPLLLGPVAPAGAATVVQHSTFRAISLDGDYGVFTECTATEYFVHVGENSDGVVTVYYASFTTDDCTGEQGYVYGSAPADQFQLTGNLHSARLVATIPLTDGETGEPAGQISVDDTWTAFGPVSMTTVVDRDVVPGDHVVVRRTTGTVRTAKVTGNLPLDLGYLGWQTRSEVTITH